MIKRRHIGCWLATKAWMRAVVSGTCYLDYKWLVYEGLVFDVPM